VASDTGKLIKDLRARTHDARAERRAARLARRWETVERAARAGLRAGGATARVAGDGAVRALSRGVRRLVGDELVPEWSAALPHAAPSLPATSRAGAAAVYLPACINRIFGMSRRDGDSRWLPEAVVAVSARAGQRVWIPPDAPGHCCATPWSSKGFRDGHALMSARLADALWRWSDGGALPVVIDASSCAHGIASEMPEALDEERRERLAAVRVLDAVAWANEYLMPHLEVRSRIPSATVHPPCSARHLGLAGSLEALASSLADDVVVPVAATCCGMAGDRGLLHPELTAAATADEADEIAGRSFDAYLCANRTCEIALEQSTGRPYSSVVQLLERATRT
jgi:D-lactate dehydrogenase